MGAAPPQSSAARPTATSTSARTASASASAVLKWTDRRSQTLSRRLVGGTVRTAPPEHGELLVDQVDQLVGGVVVGDDEHRDRGRDFGAELVEVEGDGGAGWADA